MFEVHECKLLQFAIFIFRDFHFYYRPSLYGQMSGDAGRRTSSKSASEFQGYQEILYGSLPQILVEQLEEELLRHLRLQVTHEQSAVRLCGRRPHLRAVPVPGLGCLLRADRPYCAPSETLTSSRSDVTT